MTEKEVLVALKEAEAKAKAPPGGAVIKLGVTVAAAETKKFLTEERDLYRIFVQQGGTRSGKTYGIAQALVSEFVSAYQTNQRLRISVIRNRMPSLKQSAMRDVLDMLYDWGVYHEKYHNKTENIYRVGEAEFEFFSLDDAQKVRGRERDILWVNEGNEISWEAWKQLILRTKRQAIIDYNPSDEYHWIYDYVLGEAMDEPRQDVKFLKTTYLDNPYLPEEMVREIEWLKEVDPNAWAVYGCGERGSSGTSVYPRFDEVPASDWPDIEPVFGLDFGYNVPCGLAEIVRVGEEELWMKQLLYEKKLTNKDLIQRLSKLLPEGAQIYADPASPDRIDELVRAGFIVKMADKRPHSVKDGIDFVKRHKIYVHEESVDLVREMRGYKWRVDRDGRVLDDPVKWNDHLVDGIRYAAYTHWGKPTRWLMS